MICKTMSKIKSVLADFYWFEIQLCLHEPPSATAAIYWRGEPLEHCVLWKDIVFIFLLTMKDWLNMIFHEIGRIKIRSIILKKNDLLICFHIMISILSNSSLLIGIFLACTISEEDLQNKFISHAVKYSPFLLSLWASAAQIISLNIYTLLDIVDMFSIEISKTRKDNLHSFATYLLHTIAFPVSVTVGIVFWSSYFYNKELIYPDVLAAILPPTLNHMTHSFPPFITLFYIVSLRRSMPSRISTRTSLFAILFFYGVCIIFIKIRNGHWVYFTFEEFTVFQVMLILTFCLVCSLTSHDLAYAVKDFIDGLSNRGAFRAFDNGLKIWIPAL